jgi:hypothetical protein
MVGTSLRIGLPSGMVLRHPIPRLMYSPRALLLIFFLSVLTSCGKADPEPESRAAAQAAAATARLEASEGGQVVLAAVDAHGGLEAWYRAPTSSYSWEYSNAGLNMRFKSHLVADNATRLAYHDLMHVGTPDSVREIDGRFAWNGTVAWMLPDTLSQPNPMFWATTGFYFESIPFVLADPGLRYQKLPADSLDGQPYDMVKVSFDEGVGQSDGDTYTLYVDPTTHMIRAIRYTVTFGRGRQAEGATPRETLFYYEDYVTVDGLTVPTHFRGFTFDGQGPGSFRNEAWASDISFRQPFDSSQLEVPDGARTVMPPSE